MDAGELVDVVVWVLVDGDGEYVAESDPDQLKDRYETDVGEFDAAKATRLICLTVKVPRPKPVELEATIGDAPSAGEFKVA